MAGSYGWKCACGFTTVRTSAALARRSGRVCWACRALHENGEPTCNKCSGVTTAVDADGMFVDGPGAERFIAPTRARLVDQKLCELDFERVASKPPWPTDSTRTPPVWTPRTAMTEAYEQWFLHMHASWPERKPRALADAELVAAATRAIQPMLAEMTKFAVYAQRRYKCPSCSALALEFAGTEFPS